MKDTTGYVGYEVIVYCPYCERSLDLVAEPYDDDKLGLAVFGSDVKLAKWDDLNIEYKCNHCKKDFNLKNLEY